VLSLRSRRSTSTKLGENFFGLNGWRRKNRHIHSNQNLNSVNKELFSPAGIISIEFELFIIFLSVFIHVFLSEWIESSLLSLTRSDQPCLPLSLPFLPASTGYEPNQGAVSVFSRNLPGETHAFVVIRRLTAPLD
jgi:hypothetical protein